MIGDLMLLLRNNEYHVPSCGVTARQFGPAWKYRKSNAYYIVGSSKNHAYIFHF